MSRKAIIMLVISIVTVLGASSLVYKAFTADLTGTQTETSSELFASDGGVVTSETAVSETTNTTSGGITTTTNAATSGKSQTTTTNKAVTTAQAPATQPPAAIQTPAQTTTTKASIAKGNAPDFTIYNSSGNPVKLSDYLGKAVVLNFWASWCPPCKAEMPDFQTMYQRYSGQNIVFLMVNMTDGSRETKESATAYLNSNGFTFTPLFDTKQSASSAYGISSIPSSFFITRAGNIQNKYIGQINASTLENEIKNLLK